MTTRKKKFIGDEIINKVSGGDSKPSTPPKTEPSKSGKEKTEKKGGFSAKGELMEGREDLKLDAHVDNVRNIDPSLIRVSEANARLQELLTEESVADLIKSIKKHGQIEPAEVMRLPDDEVPDKDSPRYELLSGSRRLWAVTALKKPLRAVVYQRADWDTRSAKTALEMIARSREENEAQQRPTQYEYARALARTLERWPSLRQEDVAEALGRAQGTISSLLTFAKFPLEAAQLLGTSTLRSLKPQVGARWTREWDTDKLIGLIRAVREKHPKASGARLIALIDERTRPADKTKTKWRPLPSGAKLRADWRKGRLQFEVKLQKDLKDADRTLEEVSEEVKRILESNT